MSTLAYAVRDSRTMLRRNLRHMVRYPSLTLMLVGMPLVFLLLFVYVFGGTLGAGLGGGAGAAVDGATGRDLYANYVAPAILVMTAAGVVQGTAISVAMDMTEGIIDRFRTMAIARSSVLTAHVVGSVIQTLVGTVVVAGVALLVGFRPSAGVLGWIGALGVITMLGFALSWLSVALGLAASSVETASNTPMFLVLLPFLGSGFVPTDSMPGWLAWFARYQPFTPVIETLRSLLLGTPTGASALLAVAWCVAIGGFSYLWARSLFTRVKER